jgi:hypothetical protein
MLKMKLKKYENLRGKYPGYISLDEMRRICKISKLSARYLVENGIVPATDTGKKTWRYLIDISDVIEYLNEREKYGSMIPPGAVTSRHKNRKFTALARKSFSEIVTEGLESEIAEYFGFLYTEYDDVLTVSDVVEMTGLDKSTVHKYARLGHIKSVARRPAYMIPKQYLMEFVVSPIYIESKSKSEIFRKILGGFEIWKNAKL